MTKIKVTSIETSVNLRNAIGIPETATHYKSGAMAGFIWTKLKLILNYPNSNR